MRATYALTGLTAAILLSVARAGIQAPAPKPAEVAMEAEVTVLGKVTEIERDPVEARPHFGMPTDAKVPYSVAVIKLNETMIGPAGLTQVRVGVTDSPSGSIGRGGPPLGGVRYAPIKLAVGQEGCFVLIRHPSADFYVLYPGFRLGPILKTDKDYEAVLAEVRIVAKTRTDSVAALKSKVREERFLAAYTLLHRNRRLNMGGGKAPEMEDLSPEENKLTLEILQEMPWTFERNTPPPNPRQQRLLGPFVLRVNLFPYLDPAKYGFEYPRSPPTKRGESPRDMTKETDRVTAQFLRDNMDRIKLQKHVRPK